MKSDIFDEYAKIAEAQGLIQKDAFFNSDEYSKKIENNGGRAGSDDISTIEALYGKKKDKKEKSIIEEAHPETAVVSPAYDSFNGVVENEQERQNISINIALRPPNGNANTRRFVIAKQELLESLVRIGFLMDNKNEEQVMKLADSCSSRLADKQIVKTAWEWKDLTGPVSSMLAGAGTGALWAGLSTGGIGAIPGALVGGLIGLIGGTAIVNHVSPADQGVIHNADNALQRLYAAQSDNPNLTKVINPLIKDIYAFLNLATTVENAGPISINKDDLHGSIKNLNEDDAKNIYNSIQYAQECDKLKIKIAGVIAILNRYKPQESNLAPGVDYVGKAFRALVGTTANDAQLALETLKDSLEKASKDTQAVLAAAKASAQSLESNETPKPEAPKEESAVDKAVNDFHSLTNKLLGEP